MVFTGNYGSDYLHQLRYIYGAGSFGEFEHIVLWRQPSPNTSQFCREQNQLSRSLDITRINRIRFVAIIK